MPVGSSLSGGLDSSLVVCVIDELSKNSLNPQLTFSARFRDFAKDEGKYMQMVIDKTNVDPHFVYPDRHVQAQTTLDRFNKKVRRNFSVASLSEIFSSTVL